jgi:eukaryotic-like serine/threonine-protein kinase
VPHPHREHTDEPLAIGDHLLDRYHIVERIAAGGYSIVYRAEDKRLMRPVCVKVFHRLSASDGAYQAAYEHFVQEAFALSKLTHPNTLRIYDFGHLSVAESDAAKGAKRSAGAHARGLPFQVSEYMDRGTLASKVRQEGPFRDKHELRRIITGLGGALGEAHQYGIVHRDIKPQNILFSTVGRGTVAKIADFGIAKSLPMALFSNQAEDTAVVVGKPLLMFSMRWAPPEQMAGEPVVPATDVYSLALVIIFMLTGNVVFSRQDGIKPYEQRERSHEFIRAACAGSSLPEHVVALLERACALDVGDRPQEIEGFTTALVDALSGDAARRSRPRLQTVPGGERVQAPDPPSTPLPPRRMHITDQVFAISERRLIFVPAKGGTADVTCASGVGRLRVTFVPMGDGFCVHIKGVDCFVAHAGSRPSSAVQFDADGRCDVITPDRRQISSVAVSVGKPAAGHRVFAIGTESIALSTDECLQVAMLDFGAGSDCLLVFRPLLASLPDQKASWRKTTR